MAREAQEHAQAMEAKAVAKLADLPAHSQLKDPQVLDQKKAMLESVLAKARARRAGHSAD
jgi:electron transport complex protein RnfB